MIPSTQACYLAAGAGFWQNFRRVEDRYQPTDAIRTVTGPDPQRLEEFFRAHAKAIGTGQH